jgi:hypothetical protein
MVHALRDGRGDVVLYHRASYRRNAMLDPEDQRVPAPPPLPPHGKSRIEAPTRSVQSPPPIPCPQSLLPSTVHTWPPKPHRLRDPPAHHSALSEEVTSSHASLGQLSSPLYVRRARARHMHGDAYFGLIETPYLLSSFCSAVRVEKVFRK